MGKKFGIPNNRPGPKYCISQYNKHDEKIDFNKHENYIRSMNPGFTKHQVKEEMKLWLGKLTHVGCIACDTKSKKFILERTPEDATILKISWHQVEENKSPMMLARCQLTLLTGLFLAGDPLEFVDFLHGGHKKRIYCAMLPGNWKDYLSVELTGR